MCCHNLGCAVCYVWLHWERTLRSVHLVFFRFFLMGLFPLLSLLCPSVVINSSHEYNSVLSHVSPICRTTVGPVVTRHIRSGICWNNPDSLKYGKSTVCEVEEEGRADDNGVIWGMKGRLNCLLWGLKLSDPTPGGPADWICQWPCWPSERTIKVQPRWHLWFLLSSGQEVKRLSSSPKWALGGEKELEDRTALGGKKLNQYLELKQKFRQSEGQGAVQSFFSLACRAGCLLACGNLGLGSILTTLTAVAPLPFYANNTVYAEEQLSFWESGISVQTNHRVSTWPAQHNPGNWASH